DRYSTRCWTYGSGRKPSPRAGLRGELVQWARYGAEEADSEPALNSTMYQTPATAPTARPSDSSQRTSIREKSNQVAVLQLQVAGSQIASVDPFVVASHRPSGETAHRRPGSSGPGSNHRRPCLSAGVMPRICTAGPA